MDIQPFRIAIPEDMIADLKQRLASTRWPGEISGSGWDYGSNLAYMKELTDYWRAGYDWRAQEEALNRFAHFKARMDEDAGGMGIHFIHERGRGPDPLPLVITHGWPSSIYEMTKIIPLLTDPAGHGGDPVDSFDVVAPSLPGYGFSDPTSHRGINTMRTADLWTKIMTEGLGYQRFCAHGGDWGAAVTTCLGYGYPEQVMGIHLTMAFATRTPRGPEDAELSMPEWEAIHNRARWQQEEAGYSHIQSTKPQTLSYGLNDSPTGLAAWIVEKFRTWSDCNGDVESAYTKDDLLTNVTIYWVTQTINSSTRLYYENRRNPLSLGQGERVRVPTALAAFPREIIRTPREWVEQSYNLQRWTEMPRGGHFAALEEPELLVEDIRAFFRQFRS